MYEYRSGYFLADPPHLSYGVFERLRHGYPEFIGGQRVVSVRDLGTGLDTAQEGGWVGGWLQRGEASVRLADVFLGAGGGGLKVQPVQPTWELGAEGKGGKEGDVF